MKAADCLTHESRAAIRKRDGLVAVRTGWEDEKGDRLCSTSKLQGEVGCYPLRSLSGDDWEPMVAQAEVDKLQARVAELEAEKSQYDFEARCAIGQAAVDRKIRQDCELPMQMLCEHFGARPDYELVDMADTEIRRLKAENEAMRSGEAFVGEAYDEGDLICEDNFFWNRNVDGMLHLHVSHFNDPADPRNQYPYTGPTTAPLPSEPEQNLSPEQESALQAKCVEALARVPNDFIDRLVAGEFDGPPDESCSKLKDPDATLKKPAEKFKADDPPEDTTPLPEWLIAVVDEIERAVAKFPTWPNHVLHAAAVVAEEAGEIHKEVLQAIYEPERAAREDVRKEAIQTAAMAIRFLRSIDRYDWSPCEQHIQEFPELAARLEA